VNVTLAVADGPVPAGNSCTTALTTKTVAVQCDAVGPPPVPALPPWATGALAAAVMCLGAVAAKRRRPLSSD
jgi:hypothetical protein